VKRVAAQQRTQWNPTRTTQTVSGEQRNEIQDNSIYKAGLMVSSGSTGLANRQVNRHNEFQTQPFHFKQRWNQRRGYKKINII
jgi:hypothetical protein